MFVHLNDMPGAFDVMQKKNSISATSISKD